jgi:hypothetical protein
VRPSYFTGATRPGDTIWRTCCTKAAKAIWAGKTVTPAALDPADGACGATLMLKPTSKGTESTLIEYRHALVHATAATIGLSPIAEFDFTNMRTKALWIAAGTSNGIALKNITADANASVRVVVER